MRTIGAVSAVGLTLGLTAAQCSGGARGSANANCERIVLEDTIEAYAAGDSVYAATKGDTVPKPRATCLTLYASAKDTVPKP